MTEKWAAECARMEKGASGLIFKATLKYEAQSQKGWSTENIAAEVQAAGGSIHATTVQRRLRAMSSARCDPQPTLEAAFMAAYTAENREGRGGLGGQTALDPETARRVFLEGLVSHFERLFREAAELTEHDLQNVQAIRDACDAVLDGRPVMKLVAG